MVGRLDRVELIGQELTWIYMVGIFEKAGAANTKGHANEVVRALGWVSDEDQDEKNEPDEPENNVLQPTANDHGKCK